MMAPRRPRRCRASRRVRLRPQPPPASCAALSMSSRRSIGRAQPAPPPPPPPCSSSSSTNRLQRRQRRGHLPTRSVSMPPAHSWAHLLAVARRRRRPPPPPPPWRRQRAAEAAGVAADLAGGGACDFMACQCPPPGCNHRRRRASAYSSAQPSAGRDEGGGGGGAGGATVGGGGGGGGSKDDVSGIFDAMDRNGDGVVSREEFEAYLRTSGGGAGGANAFSTPRMSHSGSHPVLPHSVGGGASTQPPPSAVARALRPMSQPQRRRNIPASRRTGANVSHHQQPLTQQLREQFRQQLQPPDALGGAPHHAAAVQSGGGVGEGASSYRSYRDASSAYEGATPGRKAAGGEGGAGMEEEKEVVQEVDDNPLFSWGRRKSPPPPLEVPVRHGSVGATPLPSPAFSAPPSALRPRPSVELMPHLGGHRRSESAARLVGDRNAPPATEHHHHYYAVAPDGGAVGGGGPGGYGGGGRGGSHLADAQHLVSRRNSSGRNSSSAATSPESLLLHASRPPWGATASVRDLHARALAISNAQSVAYEEYASAASAAAQAAAQAAAAAAAVATTSPGAGAAVHSIVTEKSHAARQAGALFFQTTSGQGEHGGYGGGSASFSDALTVAEYASNAVADVERRERLRHEAGLYLRRWVDACSRLMRARALFRDCDVHFGSRRLVSLWRLWKRRVAERLSRDRSVLALLLASQGSRVGESWDGHLSITAHAIALLRMGVLDVFSAVERSRALRRWEASKDRRRLSSTSIDPTDMRVMIIGQHLRVVHRRACRWRWGWRRRVGRGPRRRQVGQTLSAKCLPLRTAFESWRMNALLRSALADKLSGFDDSQPAAMQARGLRRWGEVARAQGGQRGGGGGDARLRKAAQAALLGAGVRGGAVREGGADARTRRAQLCAGERRQGLPHLASAVGGAGGGASRGACHAEPLGDARAGQVLAVLGGDGGHTPVGAGGGASVGDAVAHAHVRDVGDDDKGGTPDGGPDGHARDGDPLPHQEARVGLLEGVRTQPCRQDARAAALLQRDQDARARHLARVGHRGAQTRRGDGGEPLRRAAAALAPRADSVEVDAHADGGGDHAPHCRARVHGVGAGQGDALVARVLRRAVRGAGVDGRRHPTVTEHGARACLRLVV